MKIGDTIKDNDPRMGDRRLIIEKFDGIDHVRAYPIGNGIKRRPKKGFRIAVARIYEDGKKRRSGFSLERDSSPTQDA